MHYELLEQVQSIFMREIGYAPNLKMKVWE